MVTNKKPHNSFKTTTKNHQTIIKIIIKNNSNSQTKVYTMAPATQTKSSTDPTFAEEETVVVAATTRTDTTATTSMRTEATVIEEGMIDKVVIRREATTEETEVIETTDKVVTTIEVPLETSSTITKMIIMTEIKGIIKTMNTSRKAISKFTKEETEAAEEIKITNKNRIFRKIIVSIG